MTLKVFLKENKINATANQRAKIGLLISKENDSNGRINENGHNVKDYKENFLNDSETIVIIINYLTL